MLKVSLKTKVDIVFYTLAVFFSFVPLGYLMKFIPFIVDGGRAFLIIVFGFLIFMAFESHREIMLGFFLTEEMLEKINVYIVKWKNKDFDDFVGQELLELYDDSKSMLQYLNSQEKAYIFKYFSDYSFLVFPIAKVYEGVLKKILVEAGVISE